MKHIHLTNSFRDKRIPARKIADAFVKRTDMVYMFQALQPEDYYLLCTILQGIVLCIKISDDQTRPEDRVFYVSAKKIRTETEARTIYRPPVPDKTVVILVKNSLYSALIAYMAEDREIDFYGRKI